MTRAILILLVAVLTVSGPASASWKSLKTRGGGGKVCLRVGSEELSYRVLDAEKPLRLKLRGPKRIKLISRYLFHEGDPEDPRYGLRVFLDGQEEVRRLFRANALPNLALCEGEREVGALRRLYLDIPTGQHELEVLPAGEIAGQIAMRVFRESSGKGPTYVSFAPEIFDKVWRLQFESGRTSTYYHFTEDKPLRFEVIGPTTLQINTRLDFEQQMSGSTAYELQIYQDGERLPGFFYHTKKLSSASYLENPEILPGERKKLRLSVPEGLHRYEIHCAGPDHCGVAARIRIPEADLKGSR